MAVFSPQQPPSCAAAEEEGCGQDDGATLGVSMVMPIDHNVEKKILLIFSLGSHYDTIHSHTVMILMNDVQESLEVRRSWNPLLPNPLFVRMDDEGSPLLSDYSEQVERAYKFVTHPKVASAPLEKRIAFLESKNCSREVIDAAIKRAEISPSKMEEGEARRKKKRRKKKSPDPAPTSPYNLCACSFIVVVATLVVLFVTLRRILFSSSSSSSSKSRSDDDATIVTNSSFTNYTM